MPKLRGVKLPTPSPPPPPAAVDEGLIGGSLATALGLPPETARLMALALAVLVIHLHGRAVLRAIGILLLSFAITLWAALRRMKRVLLGLFVTSPPLPPTPPRKPVAAAAAELPPLPAVSPSELVSAAREVARRHDACDVLGAAQLLDAVDAGLAGASTHQRSAVAGVLGPTAETVRQRRAATLEALRLFSADDGWSGALETFGATTRFRREDGSGHMTVRVDGVIEGVPLAVRLAAASPTAPCDPRCALRAAARHTRSCGVG